VAVGKGINIALLVTGIVTADCSSLACEQAAKMMGQDDIFSVAMLASQLKQLETQFNNILDTGIPEEGRAYLGMMGFKIRINFHGEVLEINQPGMIDPESE